MNTDLILEAEAYEQTKLRFVTTDDRIVAARKLKEYVLGINEIYKKTKDSSLMDLMKRLTAKKRKVEKRLKGRPTV
ncbi:hypothetical protein ACFQ1M_14520 [Sungkyunkwania multivorans]|uniref:Uncharacterized protein n=1 Tax=Sungkyunkwania multivorans TaxID=1173618 RepID=A0ABW3D0X0_9FLAO